MFVKVLVMITLIYLINVSRVENVCCPSDECSRLGFSGIYVGLCCADGPVGKGVWCGKGKLLITTTNVTVNHNIYQKFYNLKHPKSWLGKCNFFGCDCDGGCRTKPCFLSEFLKFAKFGHPNNSVALGNKVDGDKVVAALDNATDFINWVRIGKSVFIIIKMPNYIF